MPFDNSEFSAPSYKEYRNSKFTKHTDKIKNQMIQIKSCSLKQEDKKKLMQQLEQIIISEISNPTKKQGMKTGYFIMMLWQTGNVGSHNIKKMNINPKKGYPTYDAAKEDMIKLKEGGQWELNSSGHHFAIMELFW